jgi:hypothetical protein
MPATATRHTLAAALVSLAVAACSSTSPTGGFVKIDDMEQGTAFIEWRPPPGATSGLWYASTDCTQADRIAPPPYFLAPDGWAPAMLPAPHQTFPGIVSTHASRLRTTTPLQGVWGANMSIDFAEMAAVDGGATSHADAGAPSGGEPCHRGSSTDFPGVAVDLRGYSGITFWAMADTSTGAATNLHVKINDAHTDPRGGVCNLADGGEPACYNGFQNVLRLTSTMTRYDVSFADLAQDPSWGYHPMPSALDLQHVYSLVFEIDEATCADADGEVCANGATPPVAFDIWIDDVYLAR